MDYIKDPMGIEKRSFEIIDETVVAMGEQYAYDDALSQSITKRVIHTSADFDYLKNLKISREMLEAFERLVNEPLTIFTDTHMVLSGVNKLALSKTKWKMRCLVAEEASRELAEKQQITRSMASVMLAFKEPGKKLFVFGNAPTAIFQVLDTISEDPTVRADLEGIIGIPVGFVGAEESKEALYQSDIPSIVGLGRKGGSNVAAAILNAILYHHVGR